MLFCRLWKALGGGRAMEVDVFLLYDAEEGMSGLFYNSYSQIKTCFNILSY